MKKIISTTVAALSLAIASHSAFAQDQAVAQAKTRAQVQQELAQAKQDGSLAKLNRTLYRGGGK